MEQACYFYYEGSDVMAVINVTPLTDINALIASDNVDPGDVLLLDEGIYFQTVNIQKNYIRIAAKGPGVIFEGKSMLSTAFALSNVVGVAIEGISIRNYRGIGLLIESGSGNRIVNNKLSNMINNGIELITSSGNLIWRNEVCSCLEGIRLTFGSTNNWIIQNIVRENGDDGFVILFSFDSNNAFISNKCIRNGGSAFNVFGSNSLFLDNILTDNDQGLVFNDGNDSVAIGNKIEGTKLAALVFINNRRNYFAGENHIVCNSRQGINIPSEFGMFLDNEISYNGFTGISLGQSSAGNLIMNNKLVCNLPENIVDNGTDNNLINNTDKPCEPCESPSDICDNCSD